MPKVDQLISQVLLDLEKFSRPPTKELLAKLVKSQADYLSLLISSSDHDDSEPTEEESSFSPDEITQAVGSILATIDTQMDVGALFDDKESYAPWIETRADADFYYWRRYERKLKRQLNPQNVYKINSITNKILDHLGNPEGPGNWARKGLVVGQVQSGKTANYIAVLCKAADLGYKVIIVLGGMLNTLRNQTQQRIDADFLGYDTLNKKSNYGVAAEGDPSDPSSKKGKEPRRPYSMTTSAEDFKKATADAVQVNFAALNEPVVLVIKKNVHTLKEVKDWITANNKAELLKEYPLLLLDDEADNASINTHNPDLDPTKINLGIRELLALFPRSSYLGYTATPFANIFIDPDNEDQMENGELYRDLFPKDFIYCLDAPDDYIGASTIFPLDHKSKFVKIIEDNEETLPIGHKKDFRPIALPPSLEEAIGCFILVKTIRELDGQLLRHHSMMINASRFTDVQESLKELVETCLKSYQNDIYNYGSLSPSEALAESSRLRTLNRIWLEEGFENPSGSFTHRAFPWETVQEKLHSAVASIEVITINSKSPDRLDYAHYPNGRSVIAIGGLSLSRGLTLEGLSVSYFLRNSIMYDTLLQMGRWFGYRQGYGDLCRIYMTSQSESWYSHIANSLKEFQDDLKEMERIGLTPLEFGLKVRAHPTALIVTARNKMRSASEVVCELDLEGSLVQTAELWNTGNAIAANAKVLENAIHAASESQSAPEDLAQGKLWRGVPISILEETVSSFQYPPDLLKSPRTPLLEYVSWLKKEQALETCDVLLCSKQHSSSVDKAKRSFFGIPLFLRERTLQNHSLEDPELVFRSSNFLDPHDELAGLSETEIQQIKDEFKGKEQIQSEAKAYKAKHGFPPLLLLAPIEARPCTSKGGKAGSGSSSPSKIVYAYAISFPGMRASKKRPGKRVSYVVNSTWRKKHSAMEADAGDEDQE